MVSKQDKFTRYHMKNALNAASMSVAKLCKVGAVIVRDSRTIVDGWNGTLPNEDNCCEEQAYVCRCGQQYSVGADSTPTDITCTNCGTVSVDESSVIRTRTKRSVLHAEENAILYAARSGIALEDCSMYTTYAPCLRCSRMIVAVGINKVYYMHEFKNSLGLELLDKHGVLVTKLTNV